MQKTTSVDDSITTSDMSVIVSTTATDQDPLPDTSANQQQSHVINGSDPNFANDLSLSPSDLLNAMDDNLWAAVIACHY